MYKDGMLSAAHERSVGNCTEICTSVSVIDV